MKQIAISDDGLFTCYLFPEAGICWVTTIDRTYTEDEDGEFFIDKKATTEIPASEALAQILSMSNIKISPADLEELKSAAAKGQA